jgi:hypothetical protein
MTAPMDECDASRGPVSCFHESPLCDFARAECIVGTPNTIGKCVCTAPALLNVRSSEAFARIDAGAFGAGAFYWVESGRIVSGPIGKSGEILVRGIGSTYDLRVTEDTIYVAGTPPMAFSLTGDPLPDPDADEAFPLVERRFTGDEKALSLDGAKVADGVWKVFEVETGAYYIPYENPGSVLFMPFSDPTDITTVVRAPLTIEGTASIDNVWVSGTDVYLSTLQPDRTTFVLSYVDLTIVGQ